MQRTKIQKFKKMLLGCVMLLLIAISVFAVTFGTHTANASVADIKDEYTVSTYRTTEFKITDKGALNNPYDVFPWSSFPFSYTQFRDYGLIYATVSVSMDMREQNDGYQHVYLYKTLEDKTPVAAMDYEYGGNGVNKNYSNITFHFKTRALFSFLSEDDFDLHLTIRYDASGAFADDWYNKNVVMTVTVSNHIIRTNDSYEVAV